MKNVLDWSMNCNGIWTIMTVDRSILWNVARVAARQEWAVDRNGT